MVDTPTAPGDHPDGADAGHLRHTALDEEHRRLGAKLVSFGGWEMPLSYPEGTLAEHRACRHDSVVFDVSHLGTVRVEGADAFGHLQSALSNDLRRIGPGRAQYTHLLDEDDGSVVDDIIVWWVDDEIFDVMPNASNTLRVEGAVGGTDTTATRAVLEALGITSKTSSSTHHTMMSSTTEPSASSRRWVYWARPGPMRRRSLERAAWSRSKASAPLTRTVPRWLTSKATDRVRHARCSARVPSS